MKRCSEILQLEVGVFQKSLTLGEAVQRELAVEHKTVHVNDDWHPK